MKHKFTTRQTIPALLALIVANTLIYCVQPPDYPEEPVIEYRRISKNTLRQKALLTDPNEETTQVVIGFTDGDGDLGFGDTTTRIEVRDTRLSDTTAIPVSYSLPEIDHLGAGNGISGEITLTIGTTCCIPPPIIEQGVPIPRPACRPDLVPDFKRDTVIFRIRLRDQAGRWSNTVFTEPITLICTD